jgi:hypothetical protein
VALVSGLGANQRRVRRTIQVDSIPPQRQDLAPPHRRRSGERQERPHLAITRCLVPERPELSRRYDAVTAWRFGPLANGGDRFLSNRPRFTAKLKMPFTIVRR